ncbi:MAG: NUDIX domain-containing protein [Aliidongia sp.]
MAGTAPHGEATPLPASTVLLLRDGTDGLEVFMVTRHRKSSFLAGALVFPGGGVEPGDSDPRHAEGRIAADSDLAWRIAAIREVFEETGILLARRYGESDLLGPAALAPIAARHRNRLNRREIGFGDLLMMEDLTAAPELLVPFAHWITPAALPKRFDTRFYAVRAPEGQFGWHDDRELVASRWIRPQDALAEAAAKQIQIVFATRLNLERLGLSETVDQVLTAARARPIVAVLPVVTRTAEGRIIRIPVEAGYGITEMTMAE